MSEKQGKLAKILEEEYKSKGFLTGAAAAGSKRIKEMFDIRNVLFSGSGIGSVIGRKIFGKGYTATPESSVASKISSPTPGFSSESIDVLVSIKKDTRTSAKNSMVLPSMARDMNLMRQNISKLVKLQGGTASTKADMFFKRAGERELAYESQFGKPTTTPVQIKTEEKSSGSGLFAILGTLLAGLGSLLTTAVATITTTIGGIIGGVLTAILGAITALGVAIGAALLGKFMPRVPLPTPGRTPTPTPTPQKPGGAGPTPSPSQTNRNPPTGDKVKPSQRYGGKGPGSLSIPKDVQPTDKWGKFLKFVEKKAPQLFAIAGKRLATAGFLLAIPLVGWIGAIISLGLGWATAYELYRLWREFSGMSDEKENTDNTSPTNMSVEKSAMANLIYDRFREAGFSDVQARAAVANAEAESSLNPNAHNTRGEDSVGLFQMNRKGGLGEGYSVEQLKDPETNIALAIDAAKKSKNFVNASSVEDATEAFVRDVERPKDKAGAIAKRTQIALDMQSTNLGSRVNGISTEVASANRELTTPSIFLNAPTNNNVQNNNNVQGGGSQAETYNTEFNELLKLSLS
jgi:hypothetical protein